MIREKIDEILEQIKSNPAATFGLLYPYILVIILVIGLYYIDNISNVVQQKIPPLISEVPAIEDLTVQQPKSIPPVDIKVISISTPELISKGKESYTTTCASCHGEAGAGGGPGSVGLNPAPRNFTDKSGWKNGETISEMYTTLQEGIPNGSMIAYDFLTPEEKFAIIHFIRTEFITDPPVDSESELNALDQIYNLSAGTEMPGQIPTVLAQQIIKDNSNEKIERIYSARDQVLSNGSNPSAVLLNNVTSNLRLAFSALSNSDSWRGNTNALVLFLTNNVNQNGFNGRIFNLDQNQWSSLYNYLNNLL
jgi:mono/diheme cytochrome c family protein